MEYGLLRKRVVRVTWIYRHRAASASAVVCTVADRGAVAGHGSVGKGVVDNACYNTYYSA
jgi:hypothetical protein